MIKQVIKRTRRLPNSNPSYSFGVRSGVRLSVGFSALTFAQEGLGHSAALVDYRRFAQVRGVLLEYDHYLTKGRRFLALFSLGQRSS